MSISEVAVMEHERPKEVAVLLYTIAEDFGIHSITILKKLIP